MAGRRVLDAAILFTTTRAVIRQHFRLRSEQLDLWAKTSSIAKAVQSQTSRVTLTAQTASALAKRFADTSATTQHSVQTTQTEDEVVPRKETVEQGAGQLRPKDGILQDHHYKRSEKNAAVDTAPEDELDIAQKKPSRYPTLDGSIPPTDAPVETIKQDPLNPDTSSERQAGTAQDETLKNQHKVGGKEINPAASTRSTIPEPVGPPTVRFQIDHNTAEENIPQDVNIDVFRSRRVKSTLGEAAKRGPKASLRLQAVEDTSSNRVEETTANDVDAFNARASGAELSASSGASSGAQGEMNQSGKTAYKLSAEQFSKPSEDIQSLAADLANASLSSSYSSAETTVPPTSALASAAPVRPTYEMRESRVPSTRLGRLWQYGGLATSMAFGAVGESFRRATGSGEKSGGPLMLSERNMERLVAKLSRMRGAALKLGQMMSFQDSKMLPAPIAEVLQRVQDTADYMPLSQRNAVLAADLGADWQSLFSSFDEKPIAAASIGQVHRAVLAADNRSVAVKVQYPGVADSISSDLNNLAILLTASRLLPKGLYLDKTIANARTELAWECDYEREASCQERFRSLLTSEANVFTVPATIPEASGKQVLTSEFMTGTGVTKAAKRLNQEQKNWIGTQILRLCLRELTEFRFMQTDPNWTNFLYNAESEKLELLDFGAAREFPKEFVDPYVAILVAASKGDRNTVRELSVQLGYLTGHESAAMVNAHLASVMVLAEPFSEEVARASGGDEIAVYDFENQTITDRVRAQIPVMLRERLAPPPEETYSLHRKLSGAFLMLARLGSKVRCREMFVESVERWEKAKRLSG